MYYKNNATFVGHFENGKKNGNGTFTAPDGTVYEGHFKDDQVKI
jgi:hypothetical protein